LARHQKIHTNDRRVHRYTLPWFMN
jgi:hypothetical protein